LHPNATAARINRARLCITNCDSAPRFMLEFE